MITIDLFPFDLTVWISVVSLGIAGVLWLLMGMRSFWGAWKRYRSIRWFYPQWEYVLATALVLVGIMFVVGSAQIYYDPTGLVDMFAVLALLLAAQTIYGSWRWVTRRF